MRPNDHAWFSATSQHFNSVSFVIDLLLGELAKDGKAAEEHFAQVIQHQLALAALT